MIEFLKEVKLIKDQLDVAGLILRNSKFNAQVFRVLAQECHPILAVLNKKGDNADFHELSSQLIHMILFCEVLFIHY